ncbi:MAG: hypothetical protein DHS20C19_24720 [Acidimicrobiales bacterium]|nr:MAG: hypothetical protein DHS20C19_24720 [Acidimicrobiales bacterium]
MSESAFAPPGHHHAQGDPPGTVRYWDGHQWVGDPVPAPPGYVQPVVDDRFAGVWIRIGASFVDAIVAFIVFLPVFIVVVLNEFDDVESWTEQNSTFSFSIDWPILAVGLIWLLVSWLMVGLLGGTPGKLILGLRITRDDATTTPPGLEIGARRMIPALVGQVPIIGALITIGVTLASLIWVIDDPERRSAYDRIAGTRVVHKDRLPAADPPRTA